MEKLNLALRRKISELKINTNRRRILFLEDIDVGYIPIYKVASTSLRNFFCNRQKERFFNFKHNNVLSVAEKREVERRLRKSLGVWRTRQIKRKYFLFAFVRNPLTRLYSCYLDKVVKANRQGKESALYKYGIDSEISFDAFATIIAGIPDSAADKHFRSQYFEIYHNGHWLVDFVGKFENMEEDWQRLTAQIGLETAPLKQQRQTNAGNELDSLPLTPKTARLLVERYRHDIDLLGYRDEIDAWLERKTSSVNEALSA